LTPAALTITYIISVVISVKRYNAPVTSTQVLLTCVCQEWDDAVSNLSLPVYSIVQHMATYSNINTVSQQCTTSDKSLGMASTPPSAAPALPQCDW